jgi:hypothetical protein
MFAIRRLLDHSRGLLTLTGQPQPYRFCLGAANFFSKTAGFC